MTKICNVIINNEAVTVVKFDNKEIQFPSINKDVKTVIVKYDDGEYSIVDKMEDEIKPVEEKKTTVSKNKKSENSEIVK